MIENCTLNKLIFSHALRTFCRGVKIPRLKELIPIPITHPKNNYRVNLLHRKKNCGNPDHRFNHGKTKFQKSLIKNLFVMERNHFSVIFSE